MALHRSEDKMILGVCKGIAEEYNYDVSLVRILTVVLGLISAGTVLVVYIVLGVILPLGDRAPVYTTTAHSFSSITDSNCVSCDFI